MNLELMEALKLFWPIIVIQLALQIFCMVKLLKEGSRNLNKGIWAAIILLFMVFGPITYLAVGANKGDYND